MPNLPAPLPPALPATRPAAAYARASLAPARNLLRHSENARGIEVWISLQLWRSAPDGWAGARGLEGWSFRLASVPGGIQISAVAPSGSPAVWQVLPTTSKH